MGGALFLDCYNELALLANNCSYYIEFNNFTNNTAENEGGAISWIANDYVDYNNSFSGN